MQHTTVICPFCFNKLSVQQINIFHVDVIITDSFRKILADEINSMQTWHDVKFPGATL